MIQLATLNVTSLATNGLLFEFRDGQPSRLPEYVGADDDIPEAAGMDPGAWRARSRNLRLYGIVIGTGVTLANQQASFRTRMAALIAVLNPNVLITISTTGEFGAASATLTNVRPKRTVVEFEFGSLYWEGYLELTCIKSPPNWAVVP